MRSRRHDCHAVNAICTIHLLLLQLRVAQVGPSPLQIVLHQVWGLAQGKCLLEGHCFKRGGGGGGGGGGGAVVGCKFLKCALVGSLVDAGKCVQCAANRLESAALVSARTAPAGSGLCLLGPRSSSKPGAESSSTNFHTLCCSCIRSSMSPPRATPTQRHMLLCRPIVAL